MSRRLGQHFLRPQAAARLVERIAPHAEETFLEIGAGRGALTWPLIERGARVVALELDAALAEGLRARGHPRLEVLTADALRTPLGALVPGGARLVGNLPYYISSPLLRRLLELHEHCRDGHFMLQAEVADRLAAGPGSRTYGVLSVLYALRADVRLVMRLPPEAFSPPPRVHSAVVRVDFRPHPDVQVADLNGFERLVRRSFGRRRRTLENNLQDSYPNLKQHLRLLDIAGSRRAETLSVVEFARLAAVLVEGPVSSAKDATR